MKRFICFLCSLSVLSLGIFSGPVKVMASEQELMLTEIMYNPEATDTDHEWVELYNSGTTQVTLVGGSTPLSLRLVDGGSNRVLATEAAMGSMTIQPGAYFVLAQKATTFLSDHPSFTGNLIESSGMSLGNTTEDLALRMGTDGALWGSIAYANTWGGDGDGKTLAKISLTGANELANWSGSAVLGGTPGKPNQANNTNQAPIAAFTAPENAKTGDTVSFNAGTSHDEDGSIASYRWDFGDNSNKEASQSATTHVYSSASEYTVKLVVQDDKGATGQAEKKIKVEAPVVSNTTVVKLSEFLSSPGSVKDWDLSGTADANDEWIELFNSGTESVNLEGYMLDDVADGGSSPYVMPAGTTIAAGEYKVFYKKDTKLILNNTEDSVRLLNPDGSLIEEHAYTSTKTDTSWAKDCAGIWLEDETPTPLLNNSGQVEQGNNQNNGNGGNNENNGNTGNQVVNNTANNTNTNGNNQVVVANNQQQAANNKEAAALQTSSVSDAKKNALGTLVQLKGLVTAMPEVLGSGIFYLADASSGIKIKLFEGDNTVLKLGDEVLVSGELAESYQEKYIKIVVTGKLVKTGQTGNTVSVVVPTANVNETLEGGLVQITGSVSETSGDTFYVNDGSGAVKVYIKETTGIQKPRMSVGDKVQIRGIVSQYNETYRLLPRNQEDVVMLNVAGNVLGAVSQLPHTGGNLAGLAVCSGVMLLGFSLRRRYS